MVSDQKTMLSTEKTIFLNLLCQMIHGRPVVETEEVIRQYADKAVFLSSCHMVLSLMVSGLHQSFPDLMEKYKARAIQRTVQQAERSASFVVLYHKMLEYGFSPMVLKGIICRNLYPDPELRASTDEDLLIDTDKFDSFHSFLIQNGYHLVDPEGSLTEEYEISYRNPDTNLYLEVHKSLFPPFDRTYGYLNNAFEEMEQSVKILIYGTEFVTLGYTDHLLYLILHAYKHLIYSGIGIRQISDIALFIEHYGKLIDWKRVIDVCSEYHLIKYLQAILNICEKHLGMTPINLKITEEFVDEEPLLEDILTGGVYGANDVNRLHSATMTLKAISADKQGKRTNGIIKALFPSLGYMKKSYPYLNKSPYLLPAAWAQRIYRYAFQNNDTTNAGKTLEIGKQRIKMLEEYDIINK